MTISSSIKDRRVQEFLPPQNFAQPIDFFLLVYQLRCDIEHLFQGETFMILENTSNSWEIQSMNVAACNVVAMHIPQITECSSPDSATFDILFCRFRTWSLTLFTKFCCVTAHDEIFGISLFLVMHWHGFPRSIVNQLSVPCRMRISAEKRFLTMRVNFLQCIPKIFLRFPRSIGLGSSTFSTIEKTKIDHNPRVLTDWRVAQVSPIHRHLAQIFQDLVIHRRSSPGLMRLKKTRTKALLRSKSS